MGGVIQSDHALGVLQGQRLGDHLADDDVEVGEDRHGHGARDGVRDQPGRAAGSADQP